MDVMYLVFLISGVLLGFFAGFFYFKSQRTSRLPEAEELKVQLKLELERSRSLSESLDKLNQDLKEERQMVLSLNNDKAELSANYKNLEDKLENQKEELREIQHRFAAEFKNLANEIFEEKTQKFTDQNKSNLSDLLKPLGEKLNQFELKVPVFRRKSGWIVVLHPAYDHL